MTAYERNKTMGSLLFQGCLTLFFAALCFICLFPLINLVSLSVSDPAAIMSGKVSVFPVGFTLDTYDKVLNGTAFLSTLWYTVGLTAAYTVAAMIMTVLAAYPLSRKSLIGRSVLMYLILFTMYFDGGLIPNYMVIKNVGLLDSIGALIFPTMLSAYNLVIMKNFFSAMDSSVMDAAYLDGCSEFNTLVRIVLPLSKAILATIALFYIVSRWNHISDAIYYIQDSRKYPLQLVLRQIVLAEQFSQQEGLSEMKTAVESVKAASIVLAVIPILLIYPFIQKYFTKGIMLGAVKG